MLEQALVITFVGMGCVFFFLTLLICVLNVLRIWSESRDSADISKIAVAIAVAKRQQ